MIAGAAAIWANLAAWVSRLGFNEWLTLVSAAIAIASFSFNWAVVRRQTAMQFEGLRAAHDSDLIKWADEVIEIMANAQKICRDRDKLTTTCLLYTSPSPRDRQKSRMPSSA